MARAGNNGGGEGRPIVRGKSTVVSVLDVGSSKICCLIARLRPGDGRQILAGRSNHIELLGIGHQRARGIKSGVVVDLDAAEHAIRLAVDAAERMAGVTVESLFVSTSAGRMASETYSARVALHNGEVTEADITRVLAAGSEQASVNGRSPIHSIPIGYSLDGGRGLREPLGMVGTALGVDMHVVSADDAPLRNLELCINRCHLSVEAFVVAPYSSGLSTLVDDESELGVVCIDLGGGTTTMAVFADGRFIHADGIAIGGQHVTTDIARGLSTGIEAAERLKTMYGSALLSTSDDADILSVPPIGDDGTDHPNQVPRATLNRIIRARVEETLELVRDRLNASGYASLVGRRIVLTGGASQLTGLAEMARRLLGRNVRLGRPLGVMRLPEVAKGPAFATTVGLLIYPETAGIERSVAAALPRYGRPSGNYLVRVGQWLKESF